MALSLNRPRKFGEIVEKLTNTQWWTKVAPAVRLICGIAALVLSLAALVINICTWFLPGVARYANLVAGAYFVFFVVTFIASVIGSKLSDQNRTARDLPRWVKPISTALIIYLFAQVGFGIIRPGGSPKDKPSGKSYETPYGQVHVEKTDGDIRGDLLGERFFSALLMGISFGVAAQLLFLKESKGPFEKCNNVVKQI